MVLGGWQGEWVCQGKDDWIFKKDVDPCYGKKNQWKDMGISEESTVLSSY